MSDIVCIKRDEVGSNDAAMWRAQYQKERKTVENLRAYIAEKNLLIDTLIADSVYQKSIAKYYMQRSDDTLEENNRLDAELDALRHPVSQPTEPPTVAEPVFDKLIVNETGKWFAMPPKNSVTVDDHIAIAKIWLQEAANDEDQFPDDIALAHAAIAQAESLATIATLLASVISDHDATYHYVRTQAHG